MNIHEAPLAPAPLPCAERADGGCRRRVPVPVLGWLLAHGGAGKLLLGMAQRWGAAVPSHGARSGAAATHGCWKGESPLGTGGRWGPPRGHWGAGLPPRLPGAEQGAEQVLFLWREKAAYVPGSPASGGGRRCPWCCGEAERDPEVPAPSCGTGTGAACPLAPWATFHESSPARRAGQSRDAAVGTSWHQVVSSQRYVPEGASSVSGIGRVWQCHVPAGWGDPGRAQEILRPGTHGEMPGGTSARMSVHPCSRTQK